jgi:hypothetical protein
LREGRPGSPREELEDRYRSGKLLTNTVFPALG